MSIQFTRPTSILEKQGLFGDFEVGLSHPHTKAFIKLADNGDIQIMVDEATGIILSPNKGAILLVGNIVKVLTNEQDGLRWNQMAFNPNATTYAQPTLVPLKTYAGNTYANIENYLD